MIITKVKNNNINKALQEFSRKVNQSKILCEVVERGFYKKPSTIKHHKKSMMKKIKQYELYEKNLKK